jgi:DNA/RNA endonuclease YhcR with UshA esterase domain
VLNKVSLDAYTSKKNQFINFNNPFHTMKNSDSKNDKVVKILNDLIETNLDRIKGYETAAGDSDDMEIKNFM